MKTINFGNTQINIGYDTNAGMYFACLDEQPCEYATTQEDAIEELGIRLIESGELTGIDLLEFSLRYDSDLDIPRKLKIWLENIKEDLSDELSRKYPDFYDIDIRLQVLINKDCSIADYQFYAGALCYDTNHKGYWGCSCVDIDTPIADIIEELLDGVCDDVYTNH